MTPAEGLAVALGKARRVGREWQCLCPAHNDHDPSLSITEGEDRKLLLVCRAGCDQDRVLDALKARGLWDKPEPRDRIVATYPYHDENGKLLFEVVRQAPKDFRQRRPDGIGGWVWKLDDVRRVPYRLPELIAAKGTGNGHGWRVYICEGEKDVDRLRQWGLTATTNPGGAGKWRPEYNQHFAGADVVIVADNDNAGRDHALGVAAQLKRVATIVRTLIVRGKEKADISDWIDEGLGQSDFETLIDDIPVPVGEEDRVRRLMSLGDWLSRDIPPPDFLLGEVFSTTCRLMMYAKTGLGKTSIGLAASMAMAGGPGKFLHWDIPRAAKILYIDGEMSQELFQSRLRDAVRRHGSQPEGLHPFSRYDFPDLKPLNTAEGQRYIDWIVEVLGGVDAIMFDNIQALLSGNHRDTEAWAPMLTWSQALTDRRIGQAWIHHTGRDGSHSYGDSSREWGLDTVIRLAPPEIVEGQSSSDDEADIVFDLTFDKNRRRTPENRRDYDPVRITLANDEWVSDRGGDHKRTHRISPKAQAFLEALGNALAKCSVRRPASGNRPSVTQAEWQAECLNRGLLNDAKPHSMRTEMSKYRLELLAAKQIFCNEGLVWTP